MRRSGLDDHAEFAGTLEVDISCTRCGYNLRSLATDGQCPECNASVSASLSADRLMFSEPAWLSGIARGLTVILWSIVLGGGSYLAVSIGPAAWKAFGYEPLGTWTVVHKFEGGYATGTMNVFQDMIPLITRSVFLSVMMLGVYICARRAESGTAGAGRLGLRACWMLAIICGLFALAPLFWFNQVTILAHKMPMGIYVGIANDDLRLFLDSALFISLVLFVPFFLLSLAYLAGRIPNLRLVRWCRRLEYLYATTVVAAIFLPAFLQVRVGVLGTILDHFFPVTLVANVLGIVLLIVTCRRSLRRLIPACVSYDDCFVKESPRNLISPIDNLSS